jgi:hypothetical protein
MIRIVGKKDLHYVPLLSEKLKGIKTWQIDKEDIAIALSYHLNDPFWLILADVDTQDTTIIHGILIIAIIRPIWQPIAQVVLAWGDNSGKTPTDEAMTMAKNWVKAMGITRIYAQVKKGFRALNKKYGFKVEAFTVYTEV